MWEAVKNEAREFAGDPEMWVWLAAGISTVPLTLAVNAVMGPGLRVADAPSFLLTERTTRVRRRRL